MNAKQLGDLPAYPGQIKRHGENVVEVLSTGGMTKREALAMAAMGNIVNAHLPLDDLPKLAVFCYQIADAMLAELAKESGESP